MKTLVYEFGFEDYEFEVEDIYIRETIAEIFSNRYEISCIVAENIIEDYEMWDILYEECYDEIKEAFRVDALDEYEDRKEYNKDPYSYYGVSRDDF